MLPLLQFADLVQRFAAGARASAAGRALDFTVGSVFRALGEGQAALLLWMQWLVLIVLRQTRLSTSVGAEVDTFVQDFGMARLGGTAATGQATLSRYAPTQAALVLPGATMRTADLTATFQVAADPAHPLWSTVTGAQPGYLVPAGTASADVPVQCLAVGSAGNIGAGTLTLLSSAIAGIDTVANAAAFTNGLDDESDAAVQARFPLYVSGLSKATQDAVLSAIASVQAGLTAQVAEALPRPGWVTVWVDDGSGTPSADLVARCFVAVDAVRALGINYAVLAPSVRRPAVVAHLLTVPGTDHNAAVGAAVAAASRYLNTLPLGAGASFVQLARAVAEASPDILDVPLLTLDGGGSGIPGAQGQAVRAGSVAVS